MLVRDSVIYLKLMADDVNRWGEEQPSFVFTGVVQIGIMERGRRCGGQRAIHQLREGTQVVCTVDFLPSQYVIPETTQGPPKFSRAPGRKGWRGEFIAVNLYPHFFCLLPKQGNKSCIPLRSPKNVTPIWLRAWEVSLRRWRIGLLGIEPWECSGKLVQTWRVLQRMLLKLSPLFSWRY